MGWAKYEEDNREIMDERWENRWSLSWRETTGYRENNCVPPICAAKVYPVREYTAKVYPAA